MPEKDPFKTPNRFKEVRFVTNVQLYFNDPRGMWTKGYNTFGRRKDEKGKMVPACEDVLEEEQYGVRFTTYDAQGLKRRTLVPWANIAQAVEDDAP